MYGSISAGSIETLFNRCASRFSRFLGAKKWYTNLNVGAADILPRNDEAFGIFFIVRAESKYSVSLLVNKQHIRGSPLTASTPNAPMFHSTHEKLVEWFVDAREAKMKLSDPVWVVACTASLLLAVVLLLVILTQV